MVLSLDLKVYGLEAIKKAVYRFADRASILLSHKSEAVIEAAFTFKEGVSQAQREAIVADFGNELMDQDLRAKISSETKDVRNLILAHAFSRSSLISGAK